MLQAFVIVLREGFEAFLIVAVIFSYLQKTGKSALLGAVRWGIFVSVILSGALGYLMLLGENEPLWEGISGVLAAVLVTWLIVHMWRTAPTMKKDMEKSLSQAYARPDGKARLGIFLFTTIMIAREGMETALLLIQVHDPNTVSGIALGVLAAGFMAFLWIKIGHLINLKLFFQVTAVFLLLFVCQILIYSFHEFSEAGVFPNSEFWHNATEPFSPDGIYGKWISLGMIFTCALWLAVAWIKERLKKPGTAL